MRHVAVVAALCGLLIGSPARADDPRAEMAAALEAQAELDPAPATFPHSITQAPTRPAIRTSPAAERAARAQAGASGLRQAHAQAAAQASREAHKLALEAVRARAAHAAAQQAAAQAQAQRAKERASHGRPGHPAR